MPGLITSILKRTETKIVEGKYHINASLVKTKSDARLLKDFIDVAAKAKARQSITKQERAQYRRARKLLRERGILGQVTEEI